MILKADGAELKKSIAGDFAPSIYNEVSCSNYSSGCSTDDTQIANTKGI